MIRVRQVPLTVIGITCFCFAIAAAPAGSAAEALPVLKEGKWQGQHAVYECRNFRAQMDASGALSLQCLENGKPVGKPFACLVLACYYDTPKKVHQQPRPVVRFDNPPEPVVQPSKIQLQGLLSENVRFKVEYEFRGTDIIAAGGCIDPEGITYPTQFRLRCDLGSNWNIHPFVPQDERKKILDGCCLILKEDRDGKTVQTKNPYWDVLRFRGSLMDAEIKGVFGSLDVKISPKEDTRMYGWLFPGYCPWQGYSIWWCGPNDSLALKKTVVLSVE